MTRNWRDDAACRDRHAEFDLIEGEHYLKTEARLGAAAQVCLTACPVLAECKADFDPGLDGLCGVRFGQIIGLGKRVTVGGGQGHMKLKAIKHGTQGGAQAHRRRDEKVCPSCYQAELRARQDRDRKASA